MTEKAIPVPTRVCGDCSKCCDGYLQGAAYGRPFWKGRPCHFLDAGKCSIYGNHPEDPCKTFKCVWLANTDIPGWMRPNDVNAILVWRRKEGFEYLDLSEAGEKLRAEVLSWAIMYCLQHNYNLQYMIDGGLNRIGSRAFLNLVW
ncbi:MAG: hypothetical protein WCO04_00705 [Pseudomonadota bacterium]